jgi:hypothetical protein
MRNPARSNFWSRLSILITIGDAILIFALVRYLYWRGLWQTNVSLHTLFGIWGGVAVLFSLMTGIMALVKDASRSYGLVAVCLSIVSIFFYVK